jgi:hypothetical protein
MTGHFLDNERLADLLVQQATEGLSEADLAEIVDLLAAYPDANPQAIEATAAAVMLAGNWQIEPMPGSLRARLDAVAEGFTAASAPVPTSAPPVSIAAARAARKASPSSGIAWFAAAASIVIAIAAWVPRLSDQAAQPDLVSQASPDTATIGEQRQQLLAAGQSLQTPWSTPDPAIAAVQGDVVLDSATQTGYMRFSGLPVNDPTTEQYQLWIFDETRDERYPVDGGTFNIPAGTGEVVVPILAKLPIRSPKLFAVTVERPGGVVVSSRERIVAVAPVTAG